MKFKVHFSRKNIFGKEKRVEQFITAQNPESARKLAEKRGQRVVLYQLLEAGEEPELQGMEYAKSWIFYKEWLRVTPGRCHNLSFASDEAKDMEIVEKYLDSLPEII
jgi:hypothetical protein